MLLGRVFEFTELLIDKLGVTDVGAFYPHTVTLHRPVIRCARCISVTGRARLLRAVRGLELVELPESDQCCGFGGTFAVKNADVSSAMAADKVRCVLETGAEVCTAADNSCLMQIGGLLAPERRRRPLPAPRRDPGGHRTCRAGAMIRVGDAAAAPSSRPRRGTRWPTPSCGATSATPPT